MKKKLAGVLVFLAVFGLHGLSDVGQREAEYVFARVEFNMPITERAFRFGQRLPPWAHDYPNSEHLFLTMLTEVTGVYTGPEAYQIVQLDSPDIFKYPFLYFSEPGFMDLTDEETENFREYFNRGGFAMFDDFRGRDLYNLQFMMKKVFPNREMVRLDLSHPVFHTFYDIRTLEMTPPYINEDSGEPEFWGMSDEEGRLILVANHNNDFGEIWEWVDNGDRPLKEAVQSFQFGVNYLIYAMTH